MVVPKGLLGAEATLNLNTGTFASPTLSAVLSVSDCAMKAAWDKAEGPTRLSRGKVALKTLVDPSITCKLRSSLTGDNNYQTIITALLQPDATLNVVILNNGATATGAWGWMYDAQVTQGGGSQNLGDVEFDDIEITPAITGNPVQYVQVVSGAPVYTAL
jgi:hypothetical protein